MPKVGAVTIVKEFTYRGNAEEWSNKYSFDGTLPTTSAEWKTLIDAIIAAERPMLPPDVKFKRGYGYVGASPNSQYQIDYTAPPNTVLTGSAGVVSAMPLPGDAAACIRWWTGKVSSRGKKVYCWKYFHGVMHAVGSPDNIIAGQRTLMIAYAAKMIDGTLPGSAKYCGPDGSVLRDPYVIPTVTTRTLKRRGRRPPS